MSLKLIANYSKRLGLPGYSSHQFAVTVETEISNINDVAGDRCWFSSGTGDAKRETVPAIERIEAMSQSTR